MKRNYIIGFFGLSAAALLGCPVFSGDGGGTGTCGGGSYYGGGGPYICCNYTSECPSGSVCEGNYCVGGYEGGTNEGGNEGSSGGCPTAPCGKGEVCTVVDGGATCIAIPEGGIKDGASDAPVFKGCTSDSACADAGTGYLCLDGKCVAPSNQCTDTTQCPSIGSNTEQCVQGACVPGCNPAGSNTCPTGYSCTPTGTSGVCTGNPTPCGAADGGVKTCGEGNTCVDEHCVPKCTGGDAACSTGLVCVDNGCIPNQTPTFFCDKSGTADGTQDICKSGSICLHHECYISCDGTAADAGGFCEKATGTMFPVCKAVTTSSGSHSVCATATNLGSDCDPTTTPPKDCTSGKICIDGYCL
jgi:hypothetical protein